MHGLSLSQRAHRDKAGGYGIQGLAGSFVTGIKGGRQIRPFVGTLFYRHVISVSMTHQLARARDRMLL